MKILLIKPQLKSRFSEPYLQEFDRPRQPLDLAVLSNILKQEGHTVNILDMFVENFEPVYMLDHSSDIDIFVVATAGVDRWQCPNLDYRDAIETIDFIKNKNKNAKIIVIGPHGTVRPQELLAYKNIDFVVRGEPEVTVPHLINNINTPEKVDGVCYKDVIKPVGPFMKDINELPLPDYAALKMDKYKHDFFNQGLFSIMMTSRNCPFNCSFCFKNMYGHGYRTRMPALVLQEIDELYSIGVRSIYFQDLEFCLDKQRVMEICAGLKNYDIEWGCTTRVTSVDEELLNSMAEAGCKLITYGLETADEEVLKEIDKGINIDQVRKAIDLSRKVGIKTVLTYMIGLPKDTKEKQRKSLEICKDINPDVIGDGIVCIPYPDTQIYKRGVELEIIKDTSWRGVYDGIGIIDNELDKKQVDEIWKEHSRKAKIWRYKKQYGKRFYLNPTFIKKAIKRFFK